AVALALAFGFYAGVRSQSLTALSWHTHTDYEACLAIGCYKSGEKIPHFISDPRLRKRTMTDDERAERIVAVERWIRSCEDSVVFAGTKPVGMCGKVDDYIRESAIVYGNRQVYAEQLKALHDLQIYLEECIEAD